MKSSNPSKNKVDSQAQIRDEKIRLMKERQSLWMAERSALSNSSSTDRYSKEEKVCNQKNSLKAGKGMTSHDSKSRESGSSHLSRGISKGQGKTTTKSDVVLWTAKNNEVYPDSFVVRRHGTTSGRREIAGDRLNQPSPSQSSQKSFKTKGRKAGADNPKMKPSENLLLTSQNPSERISMGKYHPHVPGDEYSFSSDKRSYKVKQDIDESVTVPDESLSTSDSSFYNLSNSTEVYLDQEANHIDRKEKFNNKEVQEFSSHRCPSCSKLMESNSNEPMICMPCGHSVCRLCSTSVPVCPVCQCKIHSTSVNISLKSVIENYKELRRKQELEMKEKQVRKYLDEYDALNMRNNLLQEEAENVIQDIEKTVSSMAHTKESMRRNRQQCEKTRSKIDELQNELEAYENEYTNYEKELLDLDKHHNKAESHLNILKDTIDTISKSKDRVKVLVNSFAPSISFDDDQ